MSYLLILSDENSTAHYAAIGAAIYDVRQPRWIPIRPALLPGHGGGVGHRASRHELAVKTSVKRRAGSSTTDQSGLTKMPAAAFRNPWAKPPVLDVKGRAGDARAAPRATARRVIGYGNVVGQLKNHIVAVNGRHDLRPLLALARDQFNEMATGHRGFWPSPKVPNPAPYPRSAPGRRGARSSTIKDAQGRPAHVDRLPPGRNPSYRSATVTE
jgi:hypothetical protein